MTRQNKRGNRSDLKEPAADDEEHTCSAHHYVKVFFVILSNYPVVICLIFAGHTGGNCKLESVGLLVSFRREVVVAMIITIKVLIMVKNETAAETRYIHPRATEQI
jgi:hypothetical protein